MTRRQCFALLMIYGGAALRANSLWMLFLAPGLFVVLDRGVVVPEEEYPERKCGDEYVEYKRKVRRWI